MGAPEWQLPLKGAGAQEAELLARDRLRIAQQKGHPSRNALVASKRSSLSWRIAQVRTIGCGFRIKMSGAIADSLEYRIGSFLADGFGHDVLG
jgi:hypothetical protein